MNPAHLDAGGRSRNVANANSGDPEVMAVTDLSVAPDADIERAVAIVAEAVVTSDVTRRALAGFEPPGSETLDTPDRVPGAE